MNNTAIGAQIVITRVEDGTILYLDRVGFAERSLEIGSGRRFILDRDRRGAGHRGRDPGAGRVDDARAGGVGSMTSWTNPVTATTGGTATAANWNTDVRDNTTYLYNVSGISACIATRTTNTSIATATSTALPFTSAIYDPLSMRGSTTLTIPTGYDGVWNVGFSIAFTANTTGVRQAILVRNANQEMCADQDNNPSSLDTSYLAASTLAQFAGGDTLTLYVWQTSGAGLGIIGTSIGADKTNAPCFLFANRVTGQ